MSAKENISTSNIPSSETSGLVGVSKTLEERKHVLNLLQERLKQETNRVCPQCKRVELQLYLQDITIAGYIKDKLYYLCPNSFCAYKHIVEGQEEKAQDDELLPEDIVNSSGELVAMNLDKRKKKRPEYDSPNSSLDAEDLKYLRQMGYMI